MSLFDRLDVLYIFFVFLSNWNNELLGGANATDTTPDYMGVGCWAIFISLRHEN